MNVALTPLRILKLGPFKGGEKQVRDIQASLKYAMKKTNLSDFGGSEFVAAYSKMMNSATQKKQKYTNLGYISAKIELGMTWVRRLKFVQYLKEVPEVKQIPVRSPVFVMGLPRTGTTFLHRLLSLDPAVRAPTTWELLAPVPEPRRATPEEHDRDRKKRANFIRKLIDTRKSMGDSALSHIHEIGYDLPEECLLGLCDEMPILLQYLFTDYMHIEDFLSHDATKAYIWYKQILQLLSYQIQEIEHPRRWTLKCPVHLFFIKEIATAFPDARLIWTHRHPVTAVTSLCSLVKAFHSVYYTPDGLNANALGQQLKKVSADVLHQASKDITDSHVKCSHVLYNELIKNPVKVVKDIYAQNGWEYTSAYEKNLNEYLEQNKREREALKKSGKGEALHHYAPELYGLTAEELSTGGFESYIEEFKVPTDAKK